MERQTFMRSWMQVSSFVDSFIRELTVLQHVELCKQWVQDKARKRALELDVTRNDRIAS